MEKKFDIIGKIQEHIAKCGGFDVLHKPLTYNLWCGGSNVDVTFLSIVDIMKGVATMGDKITEVMHDIYAIDTKGEVWNIDDFLNDDQLEEIWDSLNKQSVSVKLNVEVTFDVDRNADIDFEKVKSLGRQMVSDKLEYDLHTCYGDETFVNYDVEISKD